jgi:Ca2+-binding RTX toxin-like protein
MADVYGTNAPDFIDPAVALPPKRTTNANDVINGFGGNDVILAAGGHDFIQGGSGADYMDGGTGNDTAGYTDSAAGVSVSLLTGTGVGGDAQGDTLVGIEHLSGSEHADLLIGDGDFNQLLGISGNDTLMGFGGDDDLFGGSDNDTLNGGTGVDSMVGGQGDDTYYVDDADDEVIEAGGAGIDTVLTSVSYALGPGVDVENLATTNANGTADLFLFGNSSGNNITGNNGDNLIVGGGGTDQLTGRGGNDIYWVDSMSDEIVESAGQGIDEVWASANYVLTSGADVELLRTTNDLGVAAIRLTGNASGNALRGNAGNNRLNGGDGNDELTGLGGQDLFLFGFGFGSPLEGDNIDAITDFNVTDDTIWLDATIFDAVGGNVSADEFVIGAAAQEAGDRIIYDDVSGALFYDSDGVGGTAAVQFAELSPGLALTYLDVQAVYPF